MHPFGVRVEHSHRLYGAAVGLVTIVLAGWFLVFEPRRWMKGLGVLAVAAVIVQGVLGGTRVTQNLDVPGGRSRLRGPGVLRAHGRPLRLHRARLAERRVEPPSRCRTSASRRLGWAILALVPAQIVLGSWLRHYGTWPALVGARGRWPRPSGAAACSWPSASSGRSASWPGLVPSARALGLLATLQVVLGIGAFTSLLPFDGTPRAVSFYQAVARTAHQTNGALLLAAAVVFNLRCFRQVAGGSAFRPERGDGDVVSAGWSGCTRTGGRRLKSMASVEQLGLAAAEPRALLAAVGSRALGVPVAHQAAARAPGAGHGGGRVLPGGARERPSRDDREPGWRRSSGTALVAGGAGALNQWLERARDARMRRTANRALPSGRLAAREAARFRRPDRAGGHRHPAARSGHPGGGRRVRDVRALRLRLHAAETANDAEHGWSARSPAPCLR